jgi:hypothetical protein
VFPDVRIDKLDARRPVLERGDWTKPGERPVRTRSHGRPKQLDSSIDVGWPRGIFNLWWCTNGLL